MCREQQQQQDLELREIAERLEELEDMEYPLDFDSEYFDDPDWWREQDADMTAEELARIESLAEIQEYRTQGYMV